ncbi:probable G-protein coupled receptor 34 [Gadus morhua]|uniref:probable G-protein coupled receptor 34 n=1 Tax=Gadus morhua TaxID=8049 RepID=UPI0011B6D76A|nr:probable G-protein coupled receptor 34 [Gadus morhua]XP_030198669.1 probable G-protein coupled receptor 34 [Gadus morhua]
MMAFPFLNSSGQDSQVSVGPSPEPGPHCPSDTSSMRIPLTLFYALFVVLGLAGNLLALWVFLRDRSKQGSVRVLLVNVALSDLLLVVCLAFRVWYHGVRRERWELGATMCHVVGNFFYMNMYISIVLLGLISIDRYLKISRGGVPLQRPRGLAMRCGWRTAACALIWALALALTLLLILLSEETHQELRRCFQYKSLQHSKWKGYLNLMLVVVFWISYGCMVVCYVKIAFKLLRTSKEKPDLPNAARYARTANKSFFILVLFTVCFVPYHIVRVFYIVSQMTDTSCYWRGVVYQANEVALLFSALNSCLDPVMYFLLSSPMRKQVMQLLGNVMRVWEAGASGSSYSVEQGSGSGRTVPRQQSTGLVGVFGNNTDDITSQP